MMEATKALLRELQRIVVRLRSLAHFAGEIFRPRLKLRVVQRVARGPHLKQDGVELELHGAVENGEQLRLLLRGGETRF